MSDHLLFNGKKLYWKTEPSGGGEHINRYVWGYAVSGLKASNPFLKKLIKRGRTDIKPNTDYTDPKFQNLSSAGPIPEGAYYINLKPGMPFVKWDGGWGVGGWDIYPRSRLQRRMGFLEGWTGMDLPGVRSGFFLHHDAGSDGTAGCIGLSAQGIKNLQKYLSGYHSSAGRRTMTIKVDYSAP